MRTPLQSMMYLIEQITAILINHPYTPDKERALKYSKLIQTQLSLMETFVDDLLDLTQMKAGVFNLVPAPFDQEEVFNFILSMFEPRA